MKDEIWQKRAASLAEFSGAGLSLTEISERVGMTALTVRRYATKFGFDFGSADAGFPARSDVFEIRSDAVKQCALDGLSKKQTMERLGLGYQTVMKYAKQHGIEFAHGNEGQGVDLGRAEAMASMFRAGKTLAEIGSLYGISRERVRQIIKKRHGMTATDGGSHAKAETLRACVKALKDKKCIEKHGCTYDQYRDLVRLGTPTKAWNRQRAGSRNRGIDWNLKLWDWWQIWQKSGKWESRGRGRDRYVMCRFGDEGAYEVGNVYVATHSHNSTVQPNNPYRKDHPDHEEVMRASRKQRQRRTSWKRKYHDLPIGVTKQKTTGRYIAQIGVNGRSKYLGTFICPKLAHNAYLEAARALQ